MTITSPPSDLYDDDQGAGNTRGFRIRCYNNDFVFQGFLAGYESCTATIRHNAISTATITVASDHERIPQMLLSGARMALTYDAMFLMSGRFTMREMALSDGAPMVTFHLASDFQYLSTILGFVEPYEDAPENWENVVSFQGGVNHHDYQHGHASNVAHHYIFANAARMGLPIEMVGGTWDGLGEIITCRARMDTLADVLVDKCDAAGLGIEIGGFGGNAKLEVNFYEPVDRPDVLTVESGAIVDWSWTQAEPTATRVVIGGAGEGTAREYTQHKFATTEATMGTIKELFVDAREIGAEYEEAKNVNDELLAEVARLYAAQAVAIAAYNAAVALRHSLEVALVTAGQYRAMFGRAEDGSEINFPLDYYGATTRTGRLYQAALDAEEAAQTEYDNAVDAANDKYAAYNEIGTQISANQVLRDAQQTVLNETWQQAEDERLERAVEVLTEHGTTYGIQMTLAETSTFRYGKSFNVGDRISLDVNGNIITDVVREVTISKTSEDGLLVVPTVGSPDGLTDPHRLVYAAIRKARKHIRKLQAGR